MILLSILLYIIVGCLCVYAFQRYQHDPIPGGFPAGGAIGTLGAWIGELIPIGPELAGIYVLPCIAGAVFFIFSAAYVRKTIEFNKG